VGFKWSELAERVSGRTGRQCKDRWLNHLDPNLKTGPFTKEEVRGEGGAKAGAKAGLQRQETRIILPSYITNNPPLVASVLSPPVFASLLPSRSS